MIGQALRARRTDDTHLSRTVKSNCFLFTGRPGDQPSRTADCQSLRGPASRCCSWVVRRRTRQPAARSRRQRPPARRAATSWSDSWRRAFDVSTPGRLRSERPSTRAAHCFVHLSLRWPCRGARIESQAEPQTTPLAPSQPGRYVPTGRELSREPKNATPAKLRAPSAAAANNWPPSALEKTCRRSCSNPVLESRPPAASPWRRSDAHARSLLRSCWELNMPTPRPPMPRGSASLASSSWFRSSRLASAGSARMRSASEAMELTRSSSKMSAAQVEHCGQDPRLVDCRRTFPWKSPGRVQKRRQLIRHNSATVASDDIGNGAHARGGQGRVGIAISKHETEDGLRQRHTRRWLKPSVRVKAKRPREKEVQRRWAVSTIVEGVAKKEGPVGAAKVAEPAAARTAVSVPIVRARRRTRH
eukprot:scaffold354_cov116-Isochrysis_galbana.AAC.16